MPSKIFKQCFLAYLSPPPSPKFLNQRGPLELIENITGSFSKYSDVILKQSEGGTGRFNFSDTLRQSSQIKNFRIKILNFQKYFIRCVTSPNLPLEILKLRPHALALIFFNKKRSPSNSFNTFWTIFQNSGKFLRQAGEDMKF